MPNLTTSIPIAAGARLAI